MSFPDIKIWVCLPLMLLSLFNCSGDLSLNSEQIQEIANNNPGGEFEVLLKGCRRFTSGDPPLFILQVSKNEFNSKTDQSLRDMGYEVQISGDFREYIYKPKCQASSVLSTIEPSDISSIEVLKDVDSVYNYNAGGYNGVVIVRMKKGTAHKLIKAE